MARTLVGLDIGSSGVRAAELVPGRRHHTVRRYAEVPLAPGVVRAGSVVDAAALTAALRELWAQGRFGTKEVRLAVANAGVLVRQMDLDWMPPADFRKALRYQVADALPMPVDDATLDYHLLDELDLDGEGDQAGPRRVARILLVAAAREMVQSFCDAAGEAGLRVVAVDLLPFALVRARVPEPGGVPALSEGGEQPEAIVDIGADVTSVVVHAGGVPRFVRIIPGAGGDSITEAVRARYDWTWEEAERTKVFVGLPGHAHLDEVQRRSVAPREDGLDHAAQKVVAGAAAALVEEVATTLDFYRDSLGPAGARVDADGAEVDAAGLARVVLTGAGSRLGGLPELLGDRLGLPVEPLTAVPGLRTRRAGRRAAPPTADDAAGAAVLAVPAGLCVGAAR